jgi:hypothetical protein
MARSFKARRSRRRSFRARSSGKQISEARRSLTLCRFGTGGCKATQESGAAHDMNRILSARAGELPQHLRKRSFRALPSFPQDFKVRLSTTPIFGAHGSNLRSYKARG